MIIIDSQRVFFTRCDICHL